MALRDDLDQAARAAMTLAESGDELLGVVPAEPAPGERSYLCAYGRGDERTWLVLDDSGNPVTDREAVSRAASIAAMCELAEESAGGGELDELRERLVAIRLTESPDGIEAAEEAALELQQVIGSPPRVAEPAYLDRVGAATRRLELALGDAGSSPFSSAMKTGLASVEDFVHEVESHYKRPLA
ncbi:MAG: hypothetical protein ACRDKU_04665 [Gaiellaceae bacterium]